jgi:hypothetical protein
VYSIPFSFQWRPALKLAKRLRDGDKAAHAMDSRHGPICLWLGGLAAVVSPGTFLIILTGVVAYASALGGFVWLCGFVTRGFRVQRALEGRFYERALRLLQKWRREDELLAILRDKVPFPDDEVRQRMVVVVRELLALQKAAADRSNPHVPESLRSEIKQRSGDMLLSLWPKCQDLTLLARPGLDPAAASAKVSQIREPLDQLAEIIAATRSRIAHATLEGSSLELHDALESAGAMKWQAEEAPRIQAMLEGG